MDKETLKQLLVYTEQVQDTLNLLLEDDTLTDLNRSKLEGKWEGVAVVHNHLTNLYIKQ